VYRKQKAKVEEELKEQQETTEKLTKQQETLKKNLQEALNKVADKEDSIAIEIRKYDRLDKKTKKLQEDLDAAKQQNGFDSLFV